MNSTSTYQPARIVAQAIENHFEQQHALALQQENTAIGPIPGKQFIETIIDTAFWASLRREEGQITKLSLAFLPPGQAAQPMLFTHRLPLSVTVLTKLSPGVERAGIHLGIWHDGSNLYIWGTTRSIPDLCFVLDVSEPGLLVIKHRRLGGFGKFMNVAILLGDQVKLVDEEYAAMTSVPLVLSSLLSPQTALSLHHSIHILVQLAVSMRAHKRGGAILMVPHGTSGWQESIVHPIHYAVSPAFNGLASLLQQDETKRKKLQWQAKVRGEVDHLGGLTAIDGATILSDQYALLAFGAKIGRAIGKHPVEQIQLREPVVGSEATIVHPSGIGGTRHLSAAQFVHDQPDAVALVASQDGRFTVFAWSEELELVQAYRIEALLL